MRSVCLLLWFTVGALAQYPQSSPPWGQGSQSNNRPNYPKRPAAYGSSSYSKPSSSNSNGAAYDDPIPPNPNLESTYDANQLPAKLPILAPNGVVEIYNRVVDDLIKKLEVDFRRRDIDPMDVVIRPTPAGPVRVPGHLQKRPFRRPGAALYRAASKKGRNLNVEEEKPSFRGVGKISKGPLGEEKVEGASETTPVSTTVVVSESESPPPVAPVVIEKKDKSEESSEEIGGFFSPRSDEFFSDDENEQEVENEPQQVEPKVKVEEKEAKRSTSDKKSKKNSKKEESEEEEDLETKAAVAEGKKDVETLLQRYQTKNVNENSGSSTTKSKAKYSSKKKEEGTKENKKKQKPDLVDEPDEDVSLVEDDDDEEVQDDDDLEPGTLQSGGNRPSGGYYPQGGPPAIPAKPNAQLTGLSKIRRASDVQVSVDARSAVITARLLVGPLNVNINESVEPMERNVRATIPELEAEIILMERHGVVFLQRFTLDRAYGQDVEISIPKSKDKKNKKGASKTGNSQQLGGPPGLDPNHPMHAGAQQRYQTKMAAHISMEVVKLLRSGNLRVNIMRTAQSSMSKLKLPIKASKDSKKKKNKKSEKKDD